MNQHGIILYSISKTSCWCSSFQDPTAGPSRARTGRPAGSNAVRVLVRQNRAGAAARSRRWWSSERSSPPRRGAGARSQTWALRQVRRWHWRWGSRRRYGGCRKGRRASVLGTWSGSFWFDLFYLFLLQILIYEIYLQTIKTAWLFCGSGCLKSSILTSRRTKWRSVVFSCRFLVRVKAALSFWYLRNGQRILPTYTLGLALPDVLCAYIQYLF